MFCDVLFPAATAASSNALTSPSLNLHPNAPRLSSSCRVFFAPGIGVVSFDKHQLMATCAGLFPPRSSPTARITLRSPGSAGNTSLYANPLSPGGGFSTPY
jgi:hypothetical protein